MSLPPYPLTIRVLHALTAILMVGQVSFAAINALVYENQPELAEWSVQAHMSMGAVIFILTLLRLAWRIVGPRTQIGANGKARMLAHMVHTGLYLVLIALPVTGYVKLAALDFPITLFGVITLPTLPFYPELAGWARWSHDAVAIMGVALLALHIPAAVLHRRLAGQPVIQRMWGFRGA